MESLDDTLNKRFGRSLVKFMKLVDPERKFAINKALGEAWDRLSLNDQYRLYFYLLYRKWQGIGLYGTPYEMITNCHPYPTNWNGKPMINRLMKEGKMVSAKYDGSYGVYTLVEAIVWQMTDVTRLN